jgi:hypothetical protein
MASQTVRRVEVPVGVRSRDDHPQSDYASAFELPLGDRKFLTPEQWARATFEGAPALHNRRPAPSTWSRPTARGTPSSTPSTASHVEFEHGREFTAVMGPSGSGKSTLMHCMAGLDTPTSGRTFVGDREIGLLDDAGLTEMRRNQIGFVFQSFNLVPTLTARENITLPCRAGQGEGRPGLVRLPGRAAQDRRPSLPPPERDVRRPAAAGGLCPGADRAARPDLRR